MPTITTRPTSTDVNSGVVTGAASAHAALSDNSDSTYVTFSDGKWAQVKFAAPTLPAGGRWRSSSVRVRARGSSTGRMGGEANGWGLSAPAFPAWTFFTTGSFAVYTSASATMLDQPSALQGVVGAANPASAENLIVAEYYADWLYATQPTVAVTAPSGTITTTTRPPCAWTHTAGTDGGGQSQAQVRIFTSAQYSAGGFNPETSAAFWSIDIAGSASTVTPDVQVTNGTYRCYVRTAQSINGQPHWSAWAYSGFTVSTTPPVAPNLTVTPQNAYARNQLFVSGPAPAGTEVFAVQRSLDGGTTWETVRGASRAPINVGGNWTGYDEESALSGQATLYRAQRIVVTGNGDIGSAWSTVQSGTWVSDDVWLKDPDRPTRNRTVMVMAPAPQPQRPARKTDHEVLGRSKPIPVSDRRGSPRGTLQIESYDLTEQQAIITLFDDAPVLLLLTPPSFGLGRIWISPGDLTEGLPAEGLVAAWRSWQVPYVVVDAPADRTA